MPRVLILAAAALVATAACQRTRSGFCQKDADCASGTCDLARMLCATSDGSAGVGGGGSGGSGGRGGAAGSGCTAASCGGTKPICDLATKVCRGCQSAECSGADAGTLLCAPSGACVECVGNADCTAATKPICDGTTNACRACASGTECAALSSNTPACASSSGACVECVGNTDCKMAAKPICNTATNTCRACAADSECPADPGVCMADGHCAMPSEVVFVDYSASCPGTGSSAAPYCNFAGALAALSSARHVMVLLGGASDRLVLATTGVSPVVIGRKNSTGDIGSIPATNMTALAVSSDTALIRDLTVNLGSGSASKGIVVSGTATVTLRRVTISLGNNGLGVEADTGAMLSMDHCTVTSNPKGGILLDGAAFDIENTTVTNNGPGQQPVVWGGVLVNSLPATGPKMLKLVTIQSNMAPGLSCASGAAITGDGVFATGNSTLDVQSTCNVTPCAPMGSTCGAQP